LEVTDGGNLRIGGTDYAAGRRRNLVKVMSWYDDEWGYASQMVREAAALAGGGAS